MKAYALCHVCPTFTSKPRKLERFVQTKQDKYLPSLAMQSGIGCLKNLELLYRSLKLASLNGATDYTTKLAAFIS